MVRDNIAKVVKSADDGPNAYFGKEDKDCNKTLGFHRCPLVSYLRIAYSGCLKSGCLVVQILDTKSPDQGHLTASLDRITVCIILLLNYIVKASDKCS